MKAVRQHEFPYIYEIEPTNSCPYRCIMCPRGRGRMTRPVGFMTPATFEIILKQVDPSQKMLRLHHFGESVLHPEFSTFLKMSRSRGIIPAISLNPATLTTEMTDVILESFGESGVVCFSLDSLNSEKLMSIRGIRKSASYCLEMIHYFIRESRRKKMFLFKIIQMVTLTINVDERDPFLALKNKYPEEDVYVYIGNNFGFGDISLIRETAGDEIEMGKSDSCCTAPFDDIVVLWNGDIVLCCYDFDGLNIIGNIKEDSLVNIWNGAEAAAMRSIFRNRQTADLPLCSKCYLAPHVAAYPVRKNLNRGYDEERYILDLYSAFRIYNE